MAGTFTSTGAYSNLTRLELEQLRKADFFAGGKGLTIGDSGLLPEGVVGKGDINAEPYFTGPSVILDDVFTLTPPVRPGILLRTSAEIGDTATAETVSWFGPTLKLVGSVGTPSGSAIWSDASVNFTVAGVLAGDLLLISESDPTGPGGNNIRTVGTVSVVATTTLTLTNINNPNGPPGNTLIIDSGIYAYSVVRPSAVQLFAVPGSGPTGQEQTFLTVYPGAAINNQLGPTLEDINLNRLTGVVPPKFGLDSTVDRADSVYGSPAPRTSLNELGYRIVLYPDNGLGTGPDLTKPITSLNPIIDPAIPPGDQRLVIDYRAGIIRFSCAPQIGGNIKVSGGVNATTGRLNLYAVFWTVSTRPKGNARGLWALRSTNDTVRSPGRVEFDTGMNAWRISSSPETNAFYVRSLGPTEDVTRGAEFGTIDSTSSGFQRRYFRYRQGVGFSGKWKFLKNSLPFIDDLPIYQELEVADKTQITVGDITAPTLTPSDYTSNLAYASGQRGARLAERSLKTALQAAVSEGFGTVHLKRGKTYLTNDTGTVYVPPGVIIEGEGQSTVIESKLNTVASALVTTPAFKFGANTPYGVYDPSFTSGGAFVPTAFTSSGSTFVEGLAIIWNPVRRVWGVAWADVTAGILYFNEVRTDGTTVFAGSGVDIKQSVTPFFTLSSTNSKNHTTGHYPRLAFHEPTDQYSVVWVEEFTSGVVGPLVRLRTFQVELTPSTTSPTYIPSLSFITSTQSIPGANTFSDHPSVAVDNSSNTSPYPITVVVWSYTNNLAASGLSRARMNVGSGPSYTTTSAGKPAVYSSTDVVEDRVGGFLYAWSKRDHQLITGTAGVLEVDAQGSYMTDAGVANWATLGVSNGSKFMYLGKPKSAIPSTATYNFGFVFTLPFTSQYGTNGTVFDSTAVANRLRVKQDIKGFLYPPCSSWDLVTSSAGTTTLGGNTLTDISGVNFITSGVQVGDRILVSVPSLTYHRVVGVAATQLTIAATFGSNETASLNYHVFYAQPFNYAIVPQSNIEGIRYAGAPVNAEMSGGVIPIAGVSPLTATEYEFGQIEPDFVRLSRGNSNWLCTYQAFNTTSIFSIYQVSDFSDTLSFGATQGPVTLWDSSSCYRVHLSTCAVLLNDFGKTISPSPADDQIKNLFPTSPMLISRAGRDIEISNRSLGAREPVTLRPNYVENGRMGNSYDVQISPLNFMQRWTATKTPSLIPAVSWSGTDWTVVSPANRKFRSFLGNYNVNGSGVVHLADATFFFGTGANHADGTYQRATISVGDRIFFPSLSVTATVQSVANEHTIRLTQADSALLNLGNNTSTINIEWVLIREASTAYSTAGIKNPGFRVSSDGRITVSTSFITFADPLPESGLTALDRTELIRRKNADLQFISSNVLGDGHSLPGHNLSDAPDTGRFAPNIGFNGVAVGEPLGCNELALDTQPSVALAWGENLFGFIDHHMAGRTSVTNTVNVYRQSFGPYHSGIRDLKLDYSGTTAFASSSVWNELKVLSQHHVYTRHGRPNASMGSFATDGYRNAFGSILWTNAATTSTFSVDTEQTRVALTYTDAMGRNPITMHGPSVIQTSAAAHRNEISSLAGHALQFQAPSAPRVLWDGKQFIAAWTEGATSAQTLMLCLSGFPGDEDGGLQSMELVAPRDLVRIQMAEVAPVEVRSSGQTAFTVLDVAYSGRVYAVVWVAGNDTSIASSSSSIGITLFENVGYGGERAAAARPVCAGNNGSASGTTTFTDTDHNFTTDGVRAGDILVIRGNVAAGGRYVVVTVGTTTLTVTSGVAIPTGSSYTWSIHHTILPSGGVSYLLGISDINRDGFGTAKIAWDGKQFMVVVKSNIRVDPGILGVRAKTMAFCAIPEDGFAHPIGIVRMAGSPDVQVDAVNSLGLGTLPGGTGSPALLSITKTESGHWPNVQVGDICVVTRSLYDSTTFLDDVGWYTVASVDYNAGLVSLGHTFKSTVTFTNAKVFGAFLRGATGDLWNLPTTSGSFPRDSSPNLRMVFDGGLGASGQIADCDRIHALVYNDVRDEFAVLYSPSAGSSLIVTTFRKDRGQASPDRTVISASSIHVADMAWNGKQYLVTWANEDNTADIKYAVLDDTGLAIEDNTGTITAGTGAGGVIGTTSPTQVPGPQYGSFVATNLRPHVHNLQNRWNNKLNRWIVSGSYLWNTTTAIGGSAEAVSSFTLPSTTVTSIFGIGAVMVLNTNADVNRIRPGCKIMVTNAGTIVGIYGIMDVLNPGTATPTIVLDAVATPLGVDVTTLPAGSFFILPREDVFCWTLGYDRPVVQFADADECFLENVTMSGLVDIEEKWSLMARPMWQAAGGAPGYIGNLANSGGDGGIPSIIRSSNFNHRFLTPTMKVQTPRLVNLRSNTKFKYGQGMPPGIPRYDRNLFSNLTRRS